MQRLCPFLPRHQFEGAEECANDEVIDRIKNTRKVSSDLETTSTGGIYLKEAREGLLAAYGALLSEGALFRIKLDVDRVIGKSGRCTFSIVHLSSIPNMTATIPRILSCKMDNNQIDTQDLELIEALREVEIHLENQAGGLMDACERLIKDAPIPEHILKKGSARVKEYKHRYTARVERTAASFCDTYPTVDLIAKCYAHYLLKKSNNTLNHQAFGCFLDMVSHLAVHITEEQASKLTEPYKTVHKLLFPNPRFTFEYLSRSLDEKIKPDNDVVVLEKGSIIGSNEGCNTESVLIVVSVFTSLADYCLRTVLRTGLPLSKEDIWKLRDVKGTEATEAHKEQSVNMVKGFCNRFLDETFRRQYAQELIQMLMRSRARQYNGKGVNVFPYIPDDWVFMELKAMLPGIIIAGYDGNGMDRLMKMSKERLADMTNAELMKIFGKYNLNQNETTKRELRRKLVYAYRFGKPDGTSPVLKLGHS
jgi:hypothetical protein